MVHTNNREGRERQPKLKRLDVGCGNLPVGDVNVDLYVTEGSHRPGREQLRVREIRNFVRADAEHLPFKDKVFSECISRHTVEHVENPFRMISEMKRVTNGVVKVIAPFSFSFDYLSWLRDSVHKYWFLPYWFQKLGFKTTVKMKFLRVKIFDKKAPFWFPFFEIIAWKKTC